MMLLITRLKRI